MVVRQAFVVAPARKPVVRLCGGYKNTLNGSYGVVGGGDENDVEAASSIVAGGAQNIIDGSFSAVLGGTGNQIISTGSQHSNIAWGQQNNVDGADSSVGGGNLNSASASYAAVVGGQSNNAISNFAIVGGGYGNTISSQKAGNGGFYGVIAGGYGNTIEPAIMNGGEYAAIGGGYDNTANGEHSVVPGGKNNEAPNLQFTQVYRIYYVDAQSVADLISRSFTGVQVNVDKDLNAISVSATTSQQQRIADAIDQLDVPAVGSVAPGGAGGPPVQVPGQDETAGVGPGGSTMQVITLKSSVPGANGAASTSANVTNDPRIEVIVLQEPSLLGRLFPLSTRRKSLSHLVHIGAGTTTPRLKSHRSRILPNSQENMVSGR
jgi:hypothetical protein